MNNSVIAKIAANFLLILFSFGWGFSTFKFEIFPFSLLQNTVAEVEGLVVGHEEGAKLQLDAIVASDMTDEPLKHIANQDNHAEAELAKLASNGQFPEGKSGMCMKVATSYDNRLAILLVGDGGQIAHHWNVDYDRVFNTKLEDKKSRINGSLLLPDGSVIVNYSSYKAMARIDMDGSVIWKIDDVITHHSVELTAKNTLWVPGRIKLEQPRLGQPAGSNEDVLYEIDVDTGEINRTIYTVDILFQNSMHGQYRFIHGKKDKLHVNDVQEIGREFAMANRSLGLEATDLIVNAKRMNLVLIVSPETLEVKYSAHAPWNQPHDPDPLDDGTFLIFDNNQSMPEVEMAWGPSRILKVDPKTEKFEVMFEADWFWAPVGSDQQLYGDDLLITNYPAGYVFNVNEGRIDYWFANKTKDNRNWFLHDAEWFEASRFENSALRTACNGK